MLETDRRLKGIDRDCVNYWTTLLVVYTVCKLKQVKEFIFCVVVMCHGGGLFYVISRN